ncbi:ESPR-type extended signal peptide-containing protein, partial [Phascolarctobacterium succinatutens]|uniref:ESPR-type extended signal peptide-containing protein n=1 Tax=Phascolarctobacterium succinatutens TaxID=626940 RepID=UPI003F81DA3E
MNKVFKVIWSEARNAYVVVSEIAKNHGSKSCSTKKLLTMLIATGVMTCASMAPAMAATNVDSNANVTVKKGATVTVAENATVTVGDNAIVLGKGASAVKDSVAIGSGASVVAGNNGSSGVALGNKAHAGYKGTSLGSSAISGREGTTLVGANTNSASLYTTVVGTDSVINSDGTTYKVSFMGIKKELNVQGAAATVVGSKNTVDNKNGKVYSGVANNVMGSANTIEGSNGVTIQGIGNKVTDAYKDMNIGIWEAYDIGKGDYSALAKKESGAVAVVGGANTVSKQTDSTVIGYDNKLTGDKEKGSQNVFMAGSHNELNNVSDSLVMGNKNAITGVSNVISFGYQNAITANNAVAIGNGASVSVEGGVALGVGSVADRANAVSVGSTGANRQIINVAAGTADTDAVNVSQLKDVKSTVTNGDNIAVTETTNKDGGKEYKVALNNDITLEGDNGDIVSISGSKGTIWATGGVTAGSVAAGDVFMDGATATVSGLSNTTTAYDGFATTGKAATEEQLKEVATEAGKHSVVTEGANITVTPEQAEDGRMQYNVALNNDILLSGDNDAFVNISGSNGSVWASGSVAAGNVIMDGTTATVSGLGNTTTAYDGFANGEGKAATEEQLKEISKVADNANQGWNLSTNGGEASKVAPGETVDFSGDKNISVSNNGKDVKVELNKDIDVNSVQTNALNSKYNLSVGTMAENGIMPFFVNSTGAFYAANNNFSVDKDGNVNANSVQTNALNSKYNLSVGTMAENGIMPFFV